MLHKKPNGQLRPTETDVGSLVQAAQAGSREDFAELYLRYSPLVRSVLNRYVQNVYLVEDLLQDTFVKALLKLKQMQDPNAFPGWICRIAVNLAHNSRRRKPALGLEKEFLETLAEDQQDAAKVVARREMADQAVTVLRGMKPVDQEVLRLREMESLPYEEIACRMNCPLGTAKRRVHTARNRLQEAFLKTYGGGSN